MVRGRLAALTAAVGLLLARGVHAEESRFGDRFFRGTSPGELPTAKLVVVGGLYAGAIASVSLGVVSLLKSGSKHDDAEAFKHDQPPGFCSDLSSPSCTSYRGLHDEQRSARNTGYLLLGAGGLLALSGALTAEFWHNDAAPRVALELGPRALTLGVSGNF
jgi:hypothetical protein